MSIRYIIGCLFAIVNALTASSQEGYYDYTILNFRNELTFQDTINPGNPDTKKLNAVLFYLTNETRVKNKLTELVYNEKLEKSAQLHSDCMVEGDFFDHINSKSKIWREPNDRALYVGITNPFIAENIIEGFVLRYKANEAVYYGGPGIFRYQPGADPIQLHTYLSLGESLIEMWMNSPNHKANILSTNAVQLGCGTTFFIRKDFYDMPAVLATQNFQFYEAVQIAK